MAEEGVLQRHRELFIDTEWLQPPRPAGHDPKLSANPFAAFEQIPPRSRYQFLLDNAQYVIMTFIHGPVCKGQVALNVINDHFWVMFLDPDHDLSVRFPAFLRVHRDKLRMPIERGSDMGIFSALTDEHRKAEVEFYKARQDYSMSHNYSGLDYTAIWKGNRAADAPLLTVYRYFDSASVHKGALGDVPKTLWVMDYPNFFVDVREQDLPDFVDLLAHYERSPKDLQRLATYGINRVDERFWDTYDWFQKRFLEDEPVHGGLLDLNRYFHSAR
jgi:hypothetical protein